MGKKTRRLQSKMDSSPFQVHGSAWKSTGSPSGGWAEGTYRRTIPKTGGATIEGYGKADVNEGTKPKYTAGIRVKKRF